MLLHRNNGHMQCASLQVPNVPKHGETEKKCVWRRHHREHLKSAAFLTKRRNYLQVWRKVRQNKKLKSPPCYFELARKKGLDTEVVGQRGRRDLLRVCAQQNNLLADIHPELVKVIGPHIISEGRGDTNCRPWMSWLLRPLSGGIPQHIPTHVSDGV